MFPLIQTTDGRSVDTTRELSDNGVQVSAVANVAYGRDQQVAVDGNRRAPTGKNASGTTEWD